MSRYFFTDNIIVDDPPADETQPGRSGGAQAGAFPRQGLNQRGNNLAYEIILIESSTR